MQQIHKIVLGLVGVLALALVLVLSNKKTEPDADLSAVDAELSDVQEEGVDSDLVLGLPIDVQEVESQDSKKIKSSTSTSKSGPDAAVGAVGLGPVAAGEQVVPEVPKSPCLKASLKSDKKNIVAQIHEFKLPRKLPDMGKVCVFVDEKSVGYSKVSNDKLRIEWKISKDTKNVTALYCNKGVKCDLKCPEPEKDFWDTITDSKTFEEGTGFAEAETSEEKELQKELKALKDVLNRKPSQTSLVIWSAEAEETSVCKLY